MSVSFLEYIQITTYIGYFCFGHVYTPFCSIALLLVFILMELLGPMGWLRARILFYVFRVKIENAVVRVTTGNIWSVLIFVFLSTPALIIGFSPKEYFMADTAISNAMHSLF